MLKGCTFDNQNVNSTNDGGLYQAAIGADGILLGCSMSTTADTLTIQPGQMLVGGRVVWVNGATQVSFNDPIASGYGQVILTIDLTQTATTSEFLQVQLSVVYSATTTFPELTQDDINIPGGGTTYQAEVAVVSVVNSNITGIVRSIEQLESIDAAYNLAASKISNSGVSALYKPDGTQVGTLNIYQYESSDIIQLQSTDTLIMNAAENLWLRSNGEVSVQTPSGSLQSIEVAGIVLANNMGLSTSGNTLIITANAASQAQFRGDRGLAIYNNATTALATISASNISGSSRRYKDDIKDLTDDEAKQILQLRPVSFTWKPETGYSGNSMSVIAEEASEIDERYIYRDNDGNIEGILPNPLIAGLIKLCQMQQQKIDDLEKRVKALESK